MTRRFIITLSKSLCISALIACTPVQQQQTLPTQLVQQNDLNPGSKGPKPSEAVGSIITSFDLGQSLSPADFQVIDPAEFKTAQQRSGFQLADIHKATVSIQAQGASQPVLAELKREEISQGWVFVFRNLTVGQAKVSLKLVNASNTVLYEQSQSVLVEANLVSPVNFLLDLDAPTANCTGTQCVGSIQVTVRARTHCLGIPRFPGVGKPLESLLFSLDSIQGNIQSFKIDFGDGSPLLESASFPVRYAYPKAGRYKVTVTLNGPACKSPFEIGTYVSVGP